MVEWRGREEILDTRTPRRAERPRPEPRELPPVDLGQPQPGSAEPDVAPETAPEGGGRRRVDLRWLVVAVVTAFVIGAAVGGSTVNAQRDAASDIESLNDARVAAVVLALDGVGREGVLRIQIGLRNLGERDLRLRSLYPDGWVVVEDGRQDLRLRTSQWANATMLVVPNCEAPVPTELVARVSNGERERLLRLALPVGSNPLTWAMQESCSPVASDIFVSAVDVLNTTDAGLRMRLVLRGASRPATLVTGVSSRTPGFAVVVDGGLPTTIRGGGVTTHPVLVHWDVTDCGAANNLGSADLALEVAAEAGALAVSVQSLDPRVTAALARFAVSRCS
ncbi:MAG TPA: hypothetical protein VFR74_10355 [Jiangellales bacterium]|nr:hypothetical protein [Jiangellales bacterium]